MMKLSGRAALIAGVAFIALPAAALAQSTATPPSASAPRAPSAAPAQPGAPAQPSTSANTAAEQHVEARIKQLHTQLHITAAQDSQWNQFAQTMRDNARDMDEAAEQRAQQFATMTAVDNMQSYEKLAEDHVQHLQKLIPAFQALYDAMSPEQKKTADQVFRAGAEAHAAQKASNQ
ncbi:MAG TPA: Spy/CpxP family protein refolding chaperone [Stellaceae bacterium]|nr:Spy/CpxP family protein refolding chaperone [Stellaceae bacterium]